MRSLNMFKLKRIFLIVENEMIIDIALSSVKHTEFVKAQPPSHKGTKKKVRSINLYQNE